MSKVFRELHDAADRILDIIYGEILSDQPISDIDEWRSHLELSAEALKLSEVVDEAKDELGLKRDKLPIEEQRKLNEMFNQEVCWCDKDCVSPCTGECGCAVCHDAYMTHLETTGDW
jgi:hypothetical protein